ncbi:SMP-30/gluconolactonase/LRE family protein [Marinobacter nanhaiticus D15-8W]|uniref:SMP-30/gluconolactonase/LRE family protein n=1 Tax=Marinobacter nanhaiticus D15-8W TaxID=626887 RepID=N6WUI7_9GAMM|nr:SMP-30/gluconolactonase/LRE family protein [Marinobacter nanhaiticus]ENO14672.1 SMP-30/gluconolactonase/LRE family protein [Marinobacter nanhaiticus D15-8W]BES69641.1 SMP-30/gluconolactonase/LRE family protein [Marinobacter nanhaiticus D15-8W]
MRWVYAVCVVIFLAIGGFLFTPSPVDSRAWNPPEPPPLEGELARNELLQQAELLAVGDVYGPEDVDVDPAGRVYGGTQDGKIVRVWPDGRVETWAETGGRPLGMAFDRNGNLIVADAYKGLLSIDPPSGTIRTLSKEAEGLPFRFTDDVDIGPRGMIYFTDASSRFNQSEYMLDLLEMRPHGRLLQYNPATRKTEVLLRDLHFANGVAVSRDGKFVLVNETWKYRTLRYWLGGPKAGSVEVFVDNLPGFPDGIAADSEGRFWLALATTRNAFMDRIHPYPWVKEQIAKLPDSLKPPPEEYGLVLALDRDGKIIASLHDPGGAHLQEITSVEPHAGMLYFGSLHNDRIGRLPMSAVPALDDLSGPNAVPEPKKEQTP